jgi:hypothetical protein
MRPIVIAYAISLMAATCLPAAAWPKDADCPLAHPANPMLKFVSATLDQYTNGPPRPPDSDLETKLRDGTIHIVTYYSSYEILRDAILICSYSEIRNGRAVHVDHGIDIRLQLPGILMRCEGILRDVPLTEPNDWKRRWCVHDPDK